MKNLFLKNFAFFLLSSLHVFAQDGKFSFTIAKPVNTSAGVFKNDSILIKTLWNNVPYSPGTYTKYWDGTDDNGNVISSPDLNYKIKVLSNNVQYTWQGTIGNSSDSMTGPSKHRGGYHCMMGLTFAGSYGYYCTGYSEGSASFSKFNIATPNQKEHVAGTGNADNNYVATDGNYIYWGAFDSNNPNNNFVHAIKTSDDSPVSFSSGINFTPSYSNQTYSAIGYTNLVNSRISGLAVQKTGKFLFVSRNDLNQLQVIDKSTGALIQTFNYTNPKSLCVDASDNLWMVTGTNTVSKYTVNANGTLSNATLTLAGLVEPLALQVSTNGNLISVADGGSSQQIKFYNNITGALTSVLGDAGGYNSDATVTDSKFYLSDVNHNLFGQYGNMPFVAYQADGSFWVNDPGNYRVQHYNSNGSYVNKIMNLGANYSTFADKNNINKVFNEFLEFEVDYSVQTLSGTQGWRLKKNWGATVDAKIYNGSPRFETTLSNGRTYGFIRNVHDWEVVEFPATGQLRFTGIKFYGLGKILCSDGSLQDCNVSGNTTTIKRYALTGFDGMNNPQWSSTADLLATADADVNTGNSIAPPNSQAFSSRDKVVFFNTNPFVANTSKPSTGYHVGVLHKGANNVYQFQTEKSTHRNYSGNYPPPGYFDCGNLVNYYAGSSVNIVDRNIITSYHGEFWKNSQTNMYNHYYDNGLAIGQFGVTGDEMSGKPAYPGMAGNANTPVLVKDANGDLYLYHGDEGHHAAFHRWKITGLNSIKEQVIVVPYPSSYSTPSTNYTDLMVGLPFDAVLSNNTSGWTRNPAVNDDINPYSSLWRANTSKISFGKNDMDISIEALVTTATVWNVSRDLGTNSVTSDWRLAGNIAIGSDNNVNGGPSNQYLEVLDNAGKTLAVFYVAGSYQGPSFIYGNTAQIATGTGGTIEREILKTLPFEVKVANGNVTFTYGNYPPVTTTISDASANWKTPKTFQMRFVGKGGGGYKHMIAVQNFKFYKDNLVAGPANQAPIANAGIDKTITLPTDSTTLSGVGTDSDGTIAIYSWTKISGPTTGTITGANTATLQLSNLVKGVYQYEFIVTDNNGATGKDTIQVTVNTAGNQAPVANAGADKVIILPTNNTTLSGSGIDTDGTISSYSWIKISGPSSGKIGTANAAVTSLINLVQGIYQFELTVTDNNGATGIDTVQVTVNLAANLPPVANAGTDQAITLPVNTVTLTGSGTDADGTASSYSWIKISGPTPGILANANAASTLLNNLVQGVYQYELTVTDNNGATGKDTIKITVNTAANQAPVANAGPDKIILLPTNSTTLNGSGSDIDGTINNYKWLKITGPASGTIATSNAATTSINNLVQGIYQFQLTVTDNNGATGKDTVQVTVNAAANQLPQADAGSDRSITLPTNSVNLSGVGIDLDGTIANFLWSIISGPATGTISSPNAANTQIDGLVQGVYQFELSVTDNNGAVSKDTVRVTVNAAPNQAPIANAGANKVITLPVNTTTLSGSGNDTDGTITGYSWVKVSGPLPGIIVSPKLAVTVVNGLVQGLYEYELTVTDNDGAISKDTIQVTVNDAFNQAPVANAGTNKVITLPIDSTSVNGSGTDMDGVIVSYSWVKIAGPASGTIASPNTANTAVTYLSAGIYKFELTVTDDDGAISKDVVQVTVNAAPNQAPVANAGVDLLVTLPNDATTLIGTGTDSDGTVTSYKWTKITGPAAGIIALPNASSTTISGLAQGVYQYQLMVTDNDGLVSKDTVSVTVKAAANQPPIANAGTDIVITLPVNSTTLLGTATDLDGSIASFSWVKIAGPVPGTIASPNSGITTINNLVQGIYQYELTVSDDSGSVTTDTVQVVVNTAVNQAPLANAGGDQTITLPANSIILAGTGTDSDGAITDYVWTKISGPSTGMIASPTSPVTSVNNLVQGVYQFELTVTDNNGMTGKDTVQVTVNSAANQAPIALAGSDKVITLPINTTALVGLGTDADGSIVNYTWVKISGPSVGTISSPNSPGTVINNLAQGVYQFELTVTDNNGATGKDTVQVTVNAAANQPPIAFAGTDKAITLPTNSTTLSGSGTDADGTINSYAWTKISGPASAAIASPNSPGTDVNNLVQGVYQFELTVTDNAGATAKDTVQVTVNAAVINNNQPPVVNAGNDIDIVLPINNALLKGTATDPDGSIVSYTWKVIKGPTGYLFGTPNLTGTTIQNLFQGVYEIEFAVTDNKGATAKDTVTITVSSPRLSSGYVSNEFKVYPNPVRDIANLNITTTNMNTKLYVSVFDLSGKLVKHTEHVTTGNNTILRLDMSNISNGNYVISLVFDDGVKQNTMVVKYGGH